jgi:hypothetical protein
MFEFVICYMVRQSASIITPFLSILHLGVLYNISIILSNTPVIETTSDMSK